MPFPPPPLSTLVLPAGATSGLRLVLNGATDTITAYRADNTIAWTLSPAGYILYATDGITEIIHLDTSGPGLPAIQLNSGTAGETDGSIVLGHVAAAGSIAPTLTITTPDNAGTPTILTLIAGAGTIPRQANLDVDEINVDDGAGSTASWLAGTLTTHDVSVVDVNASGTVTGAALSGPLPWTDLTGAPFAHFAYGQTLVALNAGGLGSIPHGMASPPTIALVTHYTGGGAGAAVAVAVTSIDATNINIHASIASQNANFFWAGIN